MGSQCARHDDGVSEVPANSGVNDGLYSTAKWLDQARQITGSSPVRGANFRLQPQTAGS